MSILEAITLVVDDPTAVAERLAAAFGWRVTADYGTFAEVVPDNGPMLWLNTPSEVTPITQEGIVLHYLVEDVTSATDRARAAGAVIVQEPTRRDFGMESALARVPGGPIIDLTRPLAE